MRVVSNEMSLGALVSAVRMIAQADRATLTVGTIQTAWLGYNIGHDIISRLVQRRQQVVPALLPQKSPAYFVLEDAAGGLVYEIRWIALDRFQQIAEGSDYLDPNRTYFPVVPLILDIITSDSARNHVVAAVRDDLLALARTLISTSYPEAKDVAQTLVDAVVHACSIDLPVVDLDKQARLPVTSDELTAMLGLQAECFEARGDSGAAWLVGERIALLAKA